MKYVYTVGRHRVIGCDAVLTCDEKKDENDGLLTETWVLQVLQASLWLPKTVRIHVNTEQCCATLPHLQCFWTDPRLTRFVALECNDNVVVYCQSCDKKMEYETTDMTLLHWRSQLELDTWHGFPWFPLVTTDATFTAQDTALGNALPSSQSMVSIETVQLYQLRVLPMVRRCVHSRVLPYMMPWSTVKQNGGPSVNLSVMSPSVMSPSGSHSGSPDKARVIVALRQYKTDAWYFQVQQKPSCLSWPRHKRGVEKYPILTAWSAYRDVVSLEDFMKAIAQIVAVGVEQYFVVVNWSPDWECGPGLEWLSDNHLEHVHGLNDRLSLFTTKLALGVMPALKLYHGTSLAGASGIIKKGFRVSSVHKCPGTYYKCDPPYSCCCKGMLGPGVYFASLDKGTSNCGRAAGEQGQRVGVVLECLVEPRECKVVTPWSPELCQCRCGSTFSDHIAHWYHGQMFNSIFLDNGAGVKRFELCIRRPQQVTLVAMQEVTWNSNRTIQCKTKWVQV